MSPAQSERLAALLRTVVDRHGRSLDAPHWSIQIVDLEAAGLIVRSPCTDRPQGQRVYLTRAGCDLLGLDGASTDAAILRAKSEIGGTKNGLADALAEADAALEALE